MKTCYVEKNFTGSTRKIIEQANKIIDEYSERGYDLSLRQLYYQFVARDLLPNKVQSYKRLGGIISDGRLAGLIDWNAISDRTRYIRKRTHWDSIEQIVDSSIAQFYNDKWKEAKYYVEVWVEKDALIEVVSSTCRRKDITHFACKGYVSQSAMYQAGKRFKYSNKKNILLHLGDHDPSGIDMTRDIQDRLRIFQAPVRVKRIALNMDQIDKYNPPPNPAKVTDSRFDSYVAKYGEESWELDALDPDVLSSIIEEGIEPYFDSDLFKKWEDFQENEKVRMRELLNL